MKNSYAVQQKLNAGKSWSILDDEEHVCCAVDIIFRETQPIDNDSYAVHKKSNAGKASLSMTMKNNYAVLKKSRMPAGKVYP